MLDTVIICRLDPIQGICHVLQARRIVVVTQLDSVDVRGRLWVRQHIDCIRSSTGFEEPKGATLDLLISLIRCLLLVACIEFGCVLRINGVVLGRFSIVFVCIGSNSLLVGCVSCILGVSGFLRCIFGTLLGRIKIGIGRCIVLEVVQCLVRLVELGGGIVCLGLGRVLVGLSLCFDFGRLIGVGFSV